MSYLQRITYNAVGLTKYIASVSSLGYIQGKKLNDVLVDFLKSKNIEYKKWNGKYKGFFTAEKYNAEIVQKHFKDFKVFIRTNYPNKEVKTKQSN